MRENLIATLEDWRLGNVSAAAVADAILAATAPPVVSAPHTPGGDRRSRPWSYVARFWEQTPAGAVLAAETDAEVMHGTGSLVRIIRSLASELHGRPLDLLPSELSASALKALLPQFRNNLGRGNAAALRVPYTLSGMQDEAWLCQVDVYRVDQDDV